VTDDEDTEAIDQSARILDYARARFFRYGYSSVTIDEMASELRISKSTFYRFFASKEELLNSAVRSYSEDITRGFAVKATHDLETFIAEFKAGAALIVDAIGQLDARARDDIRATAPKIWKKLQTHQHRSISFILAQLIRAGIERGMLRSDLEPEVVGDLLAVSVVSILYGETFPTKGTSRIEALQSLADILLRGMLAPPRAKTA
jgi:Transcriptional regulator